MAKTLIAFFSRADENNFRGTMRYVEVGNTEIAVGMIKELISADVFKMEMKNSYAKDYKTCINESRQDLRTKARPELVSMPESIDEYDVVILAYPNYWGTMPAPVFTFLEAFDFTGKTILPLCTHEGSGMGASVRDLRTVCRGVNVENGLAIRGCEVGESKPQIEKWLKDNKLI